MGTIYYGGGETPIHIEDRALAHLKVVIATKLRRRESFTLSWQHPEDQPRGRTTIWLHPSIPLRFVFDEPEAPQLSRKWIEELAHSANTSGGIQLVPEHLDAPPLQVPEKNAAAPAVPAETPDALMLDEREDQDDDVVAGASPVAPTMFVPLEREPEEV